MGSGASSSVKNIRIDPQDDERPTSSKSTKSVREKFRMPAGQKRATEIELEDVRCQLEECEDQLSCAKQQCREATDKANKLEAQMAEVEGQNLDLQDQCQSLEEQLQLLQRQVHSGRDQPSIPEMDCEQTIHAKDQYIEQLERENKTVQEEIQRLKTKWKKKVRHWNNQLTEVKHENSLLTHELKMEISGLSQENASLSEKLKLAPSDSSPKKPDAVFTPAEDQRTKIILELSARISEQESRIKELEGQLENKGGPQNVNKTRKKKPLQGRMLSESSLSSIESHLDRKVSSGKQIRTKVEVLNQRCGSETDIRGSQGHVPHPPLGKKKSALITKVDINTNFDEDSQWCSKVGDPLGIDDVNRNSGKQISKWTGQIDEPDAAEFQQIAKEMKELQQQKRRRDRRRHLHVEGGRQSSGVSRDSGVNVEFDETVYDYTSSNKTSPTLPSTAKSFAANASPKISEKQEVEQILHVSKSRLSSYGSQTSLNNLFSMEESDSDNSPDKVSPREVLTPQDAKGFLSSYNGSRPPVKRTKKHRARQEEDLLVQSFSRDCLPLENLQGKAESVI